MTPPERKRQILEVAQELLQKQGYDGFSYQDISERLGIAKPSIHHHFPTKEALALALIETFAEHLREMKAALAQEPGPAAQLRAFLSSGEHACEDHEDAMCPGGAMHSNYANFPPSVQAAVRSLSDEMHGWTRDLLQRGREAGELHFVGEPADEAWRMMAALMGARQQARTHGPQVMQAVNRQVEAALLTPPTH